MKLSAWNQFKDKIVSIAEGNVNEIVTLNIGGGNIITSTISIDSIKNLNLKAGLEAYTIIKAASAMLGIDDWKKLNFIFALWKYMKFL